MGSAIRVPVAVLALVLVASSCSLYGFGANTFGQLGDGTVTASSEPIESAPDIAWKSVDVAIYHSCGIDVSGALHCWGNNTRGELGIGTWGGSSSKRSPTRVGSDVGWTAVSAGGGSSSQSYSCGIRAGLLYCWGHNGDGQIGQGTAGWSQVYPSPTQVGSSSDWIDVSAGNHRACGRRADNTLWCWGSDTGLIPTQVGQANDWQAISVGGGHQCGLRSDVELWCWGNDAAVGSGTQNGATVPTRVRSDLSWSAAEAGGSHSCAIASGELYCWGWNGYGELGLGFYTDHYDPYNPEPPIDTPQRVGAATDWIEIAVGDGKTCGIREGGALYCWGNGSAGDGTTAPSHAEPTQTRLRGWRSVSVGSFHVLGVRQGD